jgi:hypothetical protein
MAELCLHIGMSKTATTWLQKSIFPRLFGDAFRDNPRSRLLQGGIHQGGLARAFRRSPEIWRDMGGVLLRELLGRSGATTTAVGTGMLISDQSAGPRLFEYGAYVGPHWERERMDPTMLSAHLRAMRAVALAEGFAALKVILVFRRQDAWLASKYAQRSDRIVGASQADFEARIRYYLDKEDGYYSDGIILDYAVLWDALVAALGEPHVLMIPYESLREDPTGFLQRLSGFHPPAVGGEAAPALVRGAADRRTNVRATAADTWQLRPPRRATLLRSLHHRQGPNQILRGAMFRERAIHLTEALRRRILQTYRHGNRAAGARIGVDLQEFGYHD